MTVPIALTNGTKVLRATVRMDVREGTLPEGIVLCERPKEYVVWHVYLRPDNDGLWDAESGDYFQFGQDEGQAFESAVSMYKIRRERHAL